MTNMHQPTPTRTPPPWHTRTALHARHRAQRGFTLIELLIAITVMAVLAGLSWRGLDSLWRARDASQLRVNQTAVLHTVLAQWQADLDAMQPVERLNDAGVSWDGQVLRITRRSSAWRPNGSEAGLWVVAWTRRAATQVGGDEGQWLRWQSPALTEQRALAQAWAQAARWAQNPSTDDVAFETPLVPLTQWQLSYFRGNAWTNPLSSGVSSETSTPSSNNATSAPPAPANPTPDAIRLILDLPTRTGLGGRITLDWVRPNFSNTKS